MPSDHHDSDDKPTGALARLKEVWTTAVAFLAAIGAVILGVSKFKQDPQWDTLAPYLIGVVVFVLMFLGERRMRLHLQGTIDGLKQAEQTRRTGMPGKIRSLQGDFNDLIEQMKDMSLGRRTDLRTISPNWGEGFEIVASVISDINSLVGHINNASDTERRNRFNQSGRQIADLCQKGLERLEGVKARWT